MLSAIRSRKILIFFSLLSLCLFVKHNISNSITLVEWEVIKTHSFHVELPLILDPQGLLFASTVLFIAGNVIIFATSYISEDPYFKRFSLLVILFVLSINFLIFIPNLACLLLGWDGLGLISFLLVIYYKNPKSCGAGLITAFTNRLGDVLLLVSIALAFNIDSWNILSINIIKPISLIWLTIIVAAMTKRAQIPFSAWLPAAMAAPTPVSALVHSSTLVTAGVFLLIRFSPTLSKFPIFNQTLILTATVTIFIAGIIAISEIDMKKIIALSTLSQLGVIMFSLSLNLPDLTFIHLITHALFKALLFITAGNIIHWFHHTQDIRAIGNGASQLPMTATCIIVSNIALCALPFIAGFYSKDIIIESSLSLPINSIISLFLVIATALTVAYSIRLSSFCLLYLSNQPAPNISLEKGTPFIIPTLNLRIGAVVRGSAINWIFSPLSLTPFITPSIKIGPLVLTAFTLLFMVIWLTDSSYWLTPSILSFFLPSIWFINSISTQFLIKIPAKLSHFTIAHLDQGWNEAYGPQGVNIAISQVRTSAQTWQNNLFNSQIITSAATISLLCFITLCICSLRKTLLWKSRITFWSNTGIAPDEWAVLMRQNTSAPPILMFLYLCFSLIIIVVASAILGLSSILSIRTTQDRDKASPFECGFDPKKSARIPFSLRFFLLTILFLVFDIEVVLILPAPMLISSNLVLFTTPTLFLFVLILILGLLHEWNEGSLEWTK